MEHFPLLSILVFLPLVGIPFIFLASGNAEERAISAKRHALWVSLATFLLSLLLWWNFDPQAIGFQFEEKHTWLAGYGIGYHLGVDGISLFFLILNSFLMPLCILASWRSVTTQVPEYMAAFLLLATLVNGVFASLDFIMFYFFFEASLIPMFLIIGIWGGAERIYASFKFFLYTLLGSVLLLLAMLYIYFQTGTSDIPLLTVLLPELPLEVQKWLWLAFFASFAVKVPMWPVHTWLPDAHVQAPTAGSMMLAGVLLKLGAYGFIRFSIPMLPDASLYFADFVYALSVVAVIYTSLVALMQKDMKKLIAYSSIAHMGFVTIGLFTFTQQGVEGALFQMLSHGLVSAALFFCVGVLYDRVHTKEIARYGGLVHRMPRFALLFLFFTMASIGLPGTSGFVGEFLVLVGAFTAAHWVAMGAATGLILGAAYMLWLYKRVVFGELIHKDLLEIPDISRRETAILVLLAVPALWLGIHPEPVLAPMHQSVTQMLSALPSL